MSNKAKGSKYERELIHRFWKNGFAALRVAGSGSISYPSLDVIASNGKKIFAIECKSTRKDYKYISKEQVNEIINFSSLFNAIPLIAIKFLKSEWIFLKPKDFKKIKKSYMITKEEAFKKGIRFEELIID